MQWKTDFQLNDGVKLLQTLGCRSSFISSVDIILKCSLSKLLRKDTKSSMETFTSPCGTFLQWQAQLTHWPMTFHAFRLWILVSLKFMQMAPSNTETLNLKPALPFLSRCNGFKCEWDPLELIHYIIQCQLSGTMSLKNIYDIMSLVEKKSSQKTYWIWKW